MAAAYLTTIRHNPRLRAVAAILAVLFLGWTLISAYPRPHGRLLAQNVEWSGPAWYSLPRPPSNAPAPPPPVVFALLFLGARTAEEGSQMIKSALMHLSVPAHFHIVCTPDACAYVGQRFALMPRPAYEVQITLHEVKYEQLVARVQRAGLSGNYHQLAKLFLHEVLPVEVELAMFIDADMLFIRDPLALWRVFEEFRPDTIAAMPSAEENSHSGNICSCAMLMNLTLMRDPAAPLLPSSLVPHTLHSALSAAPFARAAQDGIPAQHDPVDLNDRVAWDPHALTYADQSVLHALWMYMRPRFLRLRQDWDITKCGAFYGVDPTKGAGDGDTQTDVVAAQRALQDEMRDVDGLIVPGIIHMNCIEHAEDQHSYSPGSQAFRLGWGSFITHVVTFKWVWLNRGDGSAPTSVYIVKVDKLLDEQWAEIKTT